MLVPQISRYAKKHKLRICFEEICYTNKITESEVKNYLRMMEDRVEEIEKVIDDHIELAKESIVNSKRQTLTRNLKKEQSKLND